MNWNVSYGLLILLSSIVTWVSARLLKPKTEASFSDLVNNKLILWFCLLINLGILFLFKYANFFIETVNMLFDSIRFGTKVPLLDILLPVGISFYTFQAIGYTIDVYKGTVKAEKNFFTYALFVSFFPQLVAGPIERAKHLLPQFNSKHFFDADKAMQGITMMIWGYFMKICIADHVALYVNAVYNNLDKHSGSSILLASFLFSLQIYGDFCGYSLIAIGAAKVMGFDLMENFHLPYFSTNVKNFWKRWHISLSSWFMDYVYIPLGGNRCSVWRHLLNLFITFVISGMWHGANWTFMIWGAYHGVLIMINTLWSKYGPKITHKGFLLHYLTIFSTFILVMFGWIFFRANTISEAFYAIQKIFTNHEDLFIDKTTLTSSFISILLLFIKEYIQESHPLYYNKIRKKKTGVIYISMSLLVAFILSFGYFFGDQFLYFQF